jgi:tRNA threonylcarbamoyl adenosine modification protein YeaZ
VIIAIEGASSDLSLALAEPDGSPIADDAWSSHQRQSAELLPRLLQLLARAGRPLRDATALAVGTGPGSFTGLRVAMSLAKGLAFGLERPIVGVPSLHAWLEADPGASAALTRAGAREAHVLARDDELRVVDRDDLVAVAGPLLAPAELAEAFGLADARRPRGAAAIARAAAARLERDPAGDDLAGLEPLYVRPPRGVSAKSGEGIRWP